MSYRIGIDIGGTNTDAVLLDATEKLIASTKVPTTLDLLSGVQKAIADLTKEISIPKLDRILLGTTLATNAVLEAKNLYKVGLIRLAGHKPDTISPVFGWPEHLVQTIYAGYQTVSGGYECDGRPISKLDYDEVMRAAAKLKMTGAEAIGIMGVFSFLYPDQEQQVTEWIKNEFGKHFIVQSSYEFGGSGFIERENTLLLNLALQKTFQKGFSGLETALQSLNCPILMVQNNGTVLPFEDLIRFPIKTISAGPTNSFIGGTRLAKLSDAIVVDMGGTSTDVGVVQDFFPRRSLNNIQIGGVSISFKAADTLCKALGGGSILQPLGEGQFQVGPESVARQLFQKSKSFGGDILTLTDAAVCLGWNPTSPFLRKQINCDLSDDQARTILNQVMIEINHLCEQMGYLKKNVNTVFVGGGASLFPKNLLPEGWIIPECSGVANAYGAALAEVSASIDTVQSFAMGREKILAKLKEELISKAIENGATNARVIEQHILPYHYLPGQLARVVMTASGAFY